MSPRRACAGFSLITAIFLLVVVAGLVVYMTNIRVVQQTTVLYGMQGARALQAARSGLEWGIARAIGATDSCVAVSNFTDPAFPGFNIRVECARSTHTEGNETINTFRLLSIVTSGTYGTLDYVERRLQATVSDNPP